MKALVVSFLLWLLPAGVASADISTAPVVSNLPVYWAVWGPLAVSTITAANIGISSGSFTMTAPSGDCFLMTVQNNGTMLGTWQRCAK